MDKQPLPGTVLVGDLNRFLKKNETPWPFPGSPSRAELEQRAIAAGYRLG